MGWVSVQEHRGNQHPQRPVQHGIIDLSERVEHIIVQGEDVAAGNRGNQVNDDEDCGHPDRRRVSNPGVLLPLQPVTLHIRFLLISLGSV